MLAVHFGAGNIGRGFIGQLLSQAGYEVVFVDVNTALVDELNRRKMYQVQLATAGNPQSVVEGVRAIHGQDMEAVAAAIASADLVTTAVGPNVLGPISGAIAAGIEKRLADNPQPLNVIACENMIGGSAKLKEHVFARLAEPLQAKAEQLIGFPNAAVDRIVPIQQHEDKLLVTVEPFFEWVVDRSQMVGEVPQIEGITYVDDLAPYIERKLFTVNTGHAVIAYMGYQLGMTTIDQAMQNEKVAKAARGALQETGALLTAKYGFDAQAHGQYIEKILGRFSNPLLSDDVIRVGRSPLRKLSRHDRLVGPALECMDRGIRPEHLGMAIAAALLFDYPQDEEAARIQSDLKLYGWEYALHNCTGIPAGHPLEEVVRKQARLMQEWTSTK